MKKFLSKMFPRVSNVVIDLSTSKIAIKGNDDSILTVVEEMENDKVTYSVNANPIANLGKAIPAIATRVKLEDINAGDIMVSGDKAIGWVTKVNNKSVEVIKADGTLTRHTPVKVTMFGQDGIMVVKNMFNAKSTDSTSMNNLMPYLMLSENGDEKSSLMELMMFQSMQGGDSNGMNPMMMMAMMDKDKEFDPMMMAMMGGMGNNTNNGMNPMMMAMMMGDSNSGGMKLSDDMLEKLIMMNLFSGQCQDQSNPMQQFMMMSMLK